MQIQERSVPNGIVLDMTGDLTYASRERFKGAVEGAKKKGCRHLLLNMAEVRFVDSSGLGLLALVAQSFTLTYGKVSLIKPQGYVREIMNLANIPQMIRIYDTEDDALSGRVQAAS